MKISNFSAACRACYLLSLGMFVFFGCSSLRQKYAKPEGPAFFEHEIRTKAWAAQNGTAIGLVDWTIVKSSYHGEILVAKFGETNRNTVNCLEFYAVQRSASPMRSEKYLLIGHDCGPQSKYTWVDSKVVSLIYSDSKEKLAFGIVREVKAEEADKRKRLYYALDYNFGEDFRMEANMSQWDSDLQ